MIIRMTVCDNDFTQDIESFTDNLIGDRILSNLLKGGSCDWNIYKKIIDIINPNKDSYPSDEDLVFLVNVIKDIWKTYITVRDDENSEYLIDQFNISISNTMKDMWENGEVVYYFTTNNKYITQ